MQKIDALGVLSEELYESITSLQNVFDEIRGIPDDQRLQYRKLEEMREAWKKQAREDWINHATKIEKDYDNVCNGSIRGGAAGAGIGAAVAALGPTAAMGIATTFGVASTGTAISTLSGAAATNAALAWLGGGALVSGGGGIAAGNLLLALAGPIGWTIAGIGFIASGITVFKVKQEQNCLEMIFSQISKRDIKAHKLAEVEINERIERFKKENELLKGGLAKLKTYGLDYDGMNEKQQYELGSYVNIVSATTSLMTKPILGLQPKYFVSDLNKYLSIMFREGYPDSFNTNKDVIVYLANLLYKIEIDDKGIELLGKSIKSNKSFLDALNTNKRDFDIDYLIVAKNAIDFKYVS